MNARTTAKTIPIVVADADADPDSRQRQRQRKREAPKGRQVDSAALAEVQQLLGQGSRQRDLLIEHLHLIQDRFGH